MAGDEWRRLIVEPTLVAGRYRPLRIVGSGGMGQVWLAHDELLRREVAIKEILPPRWMGADERDELNARTMREARTAARLTHPNVVRIYDVVDDHDGPWIVMEYVPSRSLQELIEADGPLSPHRAAELGLAVLDALRTAHAAGVLHRDVKPHNVLIADDGRVMLTDFGLATFDGDGGLTRPGVLLGSPQYVAPERVADGRSTAEGDLWSLGASLYAATEGRSPYARTSSFSTLAALATEPPDPAPKAGPLAPVLAGLLQRDPRLRLTAAEAERMLRKILAPPASDPELPTASAPPVPPASAEPNPEPKPEPEPEPKPEPGPEPELATGPEPTDEAVRSAAPPAGPRTGTAAGGGPESAGTGSAAGGAPPRTRRPRRRYLLPAGTAILVLLTLGLVVAVTRDGLPGNPGAGPASSTDPDRATDPPAGQGGPGGLPPVGPPPFGCRPPPPPVDRVAAEGVPAGRAALPDGWTWHTDPAGFRLPAPIGWERFPDNDVICFREPHGTRVLIVDPSPETGDASDHWRGREDVLTDDDRVTDYQLVETRPLASRSGVEWEFRWTGPEGQRLRTVEMLVRPAPGRFFAVVWHTPESDWQRNLAFLALIRDGLEATTAALTADQSAARPGQTPTDGDSQQDGTSSQQDGTTAQQDGTAAQPSASSSPEQGGNLPPGHGGTPPGHGGQPPGLGGDLPPGQQ